VSPTPNWTIRDELDRIQGTDLFLVPPIRIGLASRADLGPTTLLWRRWSLNKCLVQTRFCNPRSGKSRRGHYRLRALFLFDDLEVVLLFSAEEIFVS